MVLLVESSEHQMSGEKSKHHVFPDDALLDFIRNVERAANFYVSKVAKDVPLPSALL